MIDYFTLALTSGLIALALWRLLSRDDLDRDPGAGSVRRRPWAKIGDGAERPEDRGS